MKIKVIRMIQAELDQQEMCVVMHGLDLIANSHPATLPDMYPKEAEIAATMLSEFRDAESDLNVT